MTIRPTDQQIETALLWLRGNEGDEYESGACAAVARWIENEMRDRALKQAARKAGVPIAKARRALAKAVAENMRSLPVRCAH